MTIASGISKVLSYKKQAGLGTPASGSGGTSLPRTTSTLDLKKATYKSNTIKTSAQRADFRHGVRSVDGTISGELNVGAHKDLEASVLRQAWQTAATTGALITVTASATGPHFVRSAGSFLTDGFKVGDVVRWTGWTVATANNTKNFLITALTATDMTVAALDGSAVIAKAAGDSVTCTLAGKKTWIPQTGHTRDYYTFEHWHSDISQSEKFTDCVISQMNVKLPPSGMATIDFPIMGIDMAGTTSQVLTTPTAAIEGGNIAAVNGAVYVGGTKVALLTGLDFSVNGNFSTPGGVVGSNVEPDIFPGAIDVTGNMTVYFQDATMRDYFLNETEVSIIAAFTTGSAANAAFKGYVFPRVKVGGAGKDDGEKGLIQTMPFTAIENTTAGSSVLSTMSIQDSLVS